jgi:hypothetical protein
MEFIFKFFNILKMSCVLELMDLDRIYADELFNMKKKHDEMVKQEIIKTQVKTVINQVRKEALQGKIFYSMDERDIKRFTFLDETVMVLREVFPDCDIEYKTEEVNLPSTNPNVRMTQMRTTLKIGWSA